MHFTFLFPVIYNTVLLTFSRVVENKFEEKDCWNRYSNMFNEYIVYDEKQVAVRYVVKLSPADQISKTEEGIESKNDNESNSSNNESDDGEDMEDENDPSDEDEEMVDSFMF